jgi:hypothetical protein
LGAQWVHRKGYKAFAPGSNSDANITAAGAANGDRYTNTNTSGDRYTNANSDAN